MSIATHTRPANVDELIPGCDVIYRGPGITCQRQTAGVIVDHPQINGDGIATFAVRIGAGRDAKCHWGWLDQFEIEEPGEPAKDHREA